MLVTIRLEIQHLGDKIRAARIKRNLTQGRLGERVGVTGATINQIENEANKSVSIELLEKIDDVLQTSFAQELLVKVASAFVSL